MGKVTVRHEGDPDRDTDWLWLSLFPWGRGHPFTGRWYAPCRLPRPCGRLSCPLLPPVEAALSTGLIMQASDIIASLRAHGPDAVSEAFEDDRHPRVHTTAAHWRAMARYLHDDPELDFDWLGCLTGVDYVADDQLCAVYDLYSTSKDHWFAVKVYMPRDNPRIPSVADLWPAADWHERETYDLFGIVFEDHPDLRRILLPEDWEGHPLRKDYRFPREYHGIPGTYELDWQQKTSYPA